ncbi:UDP-xylose and UDP-N-acetylglucosamine transporter-like [Orbicella faveolata]|uniref:UDP-xylose and UDP-N-acetylglucosamine transporter-like n=1 Tax=Orbicella faveolata TaxID=48498 RepID=UPI0009E1C0D0|nr:UDP-xylose and UDP-N-acetylglucosamine transporter-like [Orbicella faveolata]
MHPAIAILLVFTGCCSNVIFLELLVREVPSCVNTVTFCQFLFIAVEGFIFTANFGFKKPVIPISNYVAMVVFFFSTNVINNAALNFNVPMPLHMIFRSGSLVANLVLGMIILKRRYQLSKYLSVLMITAGICLCTLASAQKLEFKFSSGDPYKDYLWWCVGIGLLVIALFLSARTGIYQEQMYAEHGKHPREALFYAHALPLAGFLLLSKDIYRHIFIFNSSAPLVLFDFNFQIPKLWAYLAGNIVTQYICIRSVYVLTSECASLTVTLVVTLRKFMSLMFSIFYFQNPFTLYHWCGTGLVFGGTLIFVELASKIREAFRPKKETKTE